MTLPGPLPDPLTLVWAAWDTLKANPALFDQGTFGPRADRPGYCLAGHIVRAAGFEPIAPYGNGLKTYVRLADLPEWAQTLGSTYVVPGCTCPSCELGGRCVDTPELALFLLRVKGTRLFAPHWTAGELAELITEEFGPRPADALAEVA